MNLVKNRSLVHFSRAIAAILFHVVLVALSAGMAFSLPFTVSFIARNFFFYWTPIENEKGFLVSVEIALALMLILFFNYLSRSWRDRQVAKMADRGGLVHCFVRQRFLARRRIKQMKDAQGFARDIMLISSTGFRTFVDPKGDLHDALKNCREAKIMLLNPHSEGAIARAKSILDPNVTPEILIEQIRTSIGFLKELRDTQKKIRLKLYPDTPFLKLAVLGDHIWLQHYHPGLDIESLPEYVFEHDQNPGRLYTPFYQYFLTRWEDAGIPEYDLDTDELIFTNGAGKEIRRFKFEERESEAKGATFFPMSDHTH